MEVTKVQQARKTTKMRTIFLGYLVMFCTGTIALALILVLIFYVLMSCGIILPANYAENQVHEDKTIIEAGKTLQPDSRQKLYKYALFTSKGRLIEGNLSDKQAQAAWNVTQQKDTTYHFPYNYVKVSHHDKVTVMRYSVSAQFEPPILRQYLPNAELSFFAVFCIAFLGGGVLLASNFGRKLTHKMSGLQQATKQIQAQDLDFSIQLSGVMEIDQVLHSMDTMKETLKTSLQKQWNLERSRREQISALAHDIKTPLTIIRGNVELLTETEQSEEQKNYTDYIAESIRQMEQYIKTLIEMSKAETVATLQTETINTDFYLTKIKDQVMALAAVKKISVVFAAFNLPRTLYIDPILLERAIMNVASNAVDQAPEYSEIRLTVESAGDCIHFSIVDEGPGFSAEGLKQAAEQFYMGDSSRRLTGHYGMGLYITKSIVNLHGGKLIITNSTETSGGQVCIEIPISVSPTS
ncbi:HAMP domain-containing sensor histidine kinase [Paenibacillus ottowii]|uniref:histidine kinase n=1 Tax=Paenibacillus ottowii TaxID=2315729 RepID=A0ABY3B3G3_9BACL|nr:HAMP domain-containing sensor histidine kinase [Paenibacillus ottowii]NEU27945.1 HAMP domain-containing histidine kinase [Paenibacillus polymyxa]TQR96640.1 HAMP domain-containing histidine kinase [Paenibacillus ottowii]